ncbi:Lipid A export ATP-binding/permease protein MsbA [Nymphon striatum]|nr:Lipid A export ATP-binding/permease protein MsbA [Nymphon striatum]
MIGIISATFLGIYVPVFYKNIANGFAEPYSVETSAMMLENFWMIVLFYAGIWLSWRVLEIGIVPVDGGGMRLLNKRCFALKYDKAVAESDSKLGGAYSDAISNIFIVKSFALEKNEQANIDEKADTVQRLWEFGRNFRNFFTALADAAEMADVFQNDDFEKDQTNAKDLVISKGEFKLRISILLMLAVRKAIPGEKIALVGHSGSGKTSLTKLLFRFFEPQQGKILFDGQDAKDFTLQSLRNQISLVPQQPELFHRTVRDNILLGAESLPDQFETMVGERGVKLSGGEKQRIALARAFLEDAPIVVLDEATSALDSITEKQIQSAIFELIEKKTAIVIAHRLVYHFAYGSHSGAR